MMTELEKRAVKEDLTTAFNKHVYKGHPSNLAVGHRSKLGRGLQHAIYGPASAAAAIPGKMVGGSLGSILFGAKEMNPMSPMFEKRLKKVPGVGGLEEISKAEYKEIKGGSQKGKAYKFKGEGHLMPVYYKRKYTPGGLVGFAKKHPLLAGGGGLLAYYLTKNPQTMAAAREMLPKPNVDVSPEVIRQWREPNVESPFQRRAWG
ncbi:MAG: hypothetical protein CL582_21890 [Alteromonadaceae bacterium]|nr:hypothetical protein [Alteromonadaceae bacterium]|tara:strand:- start:1127 stop:1738 length:612 start_codon:yes stop_codon:yes gene_type:complete